MHKWGRKEEGWGVVLVDMIKILVNLQEVIWTQARRREWMVSVCFCLCWDLCEMRLFHHMAPTLSLSPPVSVATDPRLIDLAAYTTAARGVNPISPRKYKTSAPLRTLIKPPDHLSEKPYSCKPEKLLGLWRSSKSLLALKLPGSPSLTQHR